jgi:hypothetical protein
MHMFRGRTVVPAALSIVLAPLGEVIFARAGKREIEVELEALTSNATCMRVIARDGGIFYDSSTATEIILQTEKVLNGGRA